MLPFFATNGHIDEIKNNCAKEIENAIERCVSNRLKQIDALLDKEIASILQQKKYADGFEREQLAAEISGLREALRIIQQHHNS